MMASLYTHMMVYDGKGNVARVPLALYDEWKSAKISKKKQPELPWKAIKGKHS